MTYFIIGLLLVSVGCVLIFNSCGKDGNRLGIAYIGLMLCIVGMACLLHNNPQAIDVYRGKTILKITYKDSIPVDSTVVFKE